ncbi:MAG: hypothetical protein QOG42_304 [Solirubrobacteraceae bacterium]|jgi:hypothetical protein|nr:hypothetical protein [Solirubrobacteraceae bacterium]
MSELELDPLLLETLRTLQQHDVEFVLVGDVAEAIYNNGGFVSGVAIVPGAYGRNVERLNGALQAMDAELGIAGTPAATQVDYRRTDLRELAPCSFITRYVDVDLNFEPLGTRGYRDLFDEAKHIELAPSINPLVADRADLERIGRAVAPAAPYAKPPAALPPEPDDLVYSPADDIRASRSSHSSHSGF